ncbi:MAG TPA: glycosyltransferase 87 family protein, partial [Anaerolineales bacterium]|nr:glycosyltransferase 87 family protein [Anaerolineales bacterium]
YQAARAVWMVINLFLWIVGLIRLRNLLDWPRKGWRTWSMNLLATYIFAWSTWKFEQTGILLFAITVETVIAYRKRRWNLMGIFLAAALIKPNIMLIPVGILCLWLMRNKVYRPVILMTVLLAGLVLLTTILTPGWYQPLLQPNFGQGLTEVLDGPDKTTGIRLNTTLLDWLKILKVPPNIALIIYGVAIAVSLFVVGKVVWKSQSILEVTVIALLVNFAITPYALQYDFAPMTVPLFWGAALAAHAGSVKIPTLLIAFIASVLIWERPISDGYWIVIGLCALVFWSIRLNKDIQLNG